jgi:hypothetical protein
MTEKAASGLRSPSPRTIPSADPLAPAKCGAAPAPLLYSALARFVFVPLTIAILLGTIRLEARGCGQIDRPPGRAMNCEARFSALVGGATCGDRAGEDLRVAWESWRKDLGGFGAALSWRNDTGRVTIMAE